ncbi:hypothetical protein [Mycobacteroides abscessus]|uniref:hypothetical protein n=1 Tax=Mycobacteroides abscessus TaxID=36809 RepID=UPI0009C7CF26|nr:hypothetical protein [Mycobacteroides abscessus]QSN49632.1 hypothetical protein I3U33_26515 [Mycobacteroides abscessus subsp. abscessus]SKS81940.1 Uncharacterised protein [Mycobacteroides abscessus subsp. bolletii]
MRIWAGGLATDLVSCVDGLLSGPPADWSPEPDEETGESESLDAQWREETEGEVF